MSDLEHTVIRPVQRQFFRLADPLPKKIAGSVKSMNEGMASPVARVVVRAINAGFIRPPRRGEWYLSGAIIAAYMAHEDLKSPYHIARLVIVKEREVCTVERVIIQTVGPKPEP